MLVGVILGLMGSYKVVGEVVMGLVEVIMELMGGYQEVGGEYHGRLSWDWWKVIMGLLGAIMGLVEVMKLIGFIMLLVEGYHGDGLRLSWDWWEIIMGMVVIMGLLGVYIGVGD